MNLTVKNLRDIGRFQWCVLVLHGFACMLSNWSSYGILIICWKVDHWCSDPAPSFLNLSVTDQKRVMTPPSGEQCQRPDVDLQTLSTAELLNLNSTAMNWTTCTTDELVYDRSMMDYTAFEQYGLACGNEWLISLSNTVYMLGYFTSAIIVGDLSDRFGRKIVLICSGFIAFLSNILAAFAPTLTVFFLARFAVAVGEMGGYMASYIIALEIVTQSQRIVPGIIERIGSNILSLILFAAVSMLVRHHQYFQVLVGANILLITLLQWWFLPESPRWLVSVDRADDAQNIVNRIAQFNKQNPEQLQHLSTRHETTKDKCTLLDLVRTPVLRHRTLVQCLTWFSLVLVWFALLFNMGDFGKDVRTSLMINAAFEIPSIILITLCLDRFGRQVCSFVAQLITAVCCLSMAPFISYKNSAWLLALALAGRVFAGSAFHITYQHTPELFPTVIRTMGMGSCSTFARIGGLLAPTIVLLNSFWPPTMVVTLGTVALFSTLAAPCLPDTTGHELPQTLEDGEHFMAKHRYKLVLPPAGRTRRLVYENGQHRGDDKEIQSMNAESTM